MDWKEGRQDSGYFKKLLRRSKWPFGHDILLLKYPTGSKIEWHKDTVKGKSHYRLNIVLNWWFEGGEFQSENDVMFSLGPVTFFRPDKNKHRVTEIKNGTRYVFSFGMAI